MRRIFFISLLILLFSCIGNEVGPIKIRDVAELTDGWDGEVVGSSMESYVGWDVEIGDADNDGLNEIILATGEGDRTKKGTSYVLMVEKADSD